MLLFWIALCRFSSYLAFGILFVTTVILCFASTPVNADQPNSNGSLSLQVGVIDAPFMGYIDDKGLMTGFEVELAQAICNGLQRQCVIKLQPFHINLQQVQTAELDFALSSFLITEQRKQKSLFSERYMRSHSSYLGNVSQPQYRALRIGVVKGSTQERYLLQKIRNAVETVSFIDIQSTYKALMAGEVDQVLFPAIIQLKFLAEHPELELELLGEPLSDHNLGGEVGVGLPFGHEVLRDEINQVLRTLLTDGTYNKLNKKYFPFNVY
ncbi:polar amino acid transport system substrate-binding protein [Oceanospirillum multiglobuliferum]|nr:transporter substrate-binding domain-containing protein [Oceanospirillum multiglobuliferum]SJZ94214.1 polar amino acid transport system substrate-binding protein [Oceanospirillum multiglobuliferum]